MILTRHFVFVHIPKTGGSFVRAVIQRHAPVAWQVETSDLHPSVRDIPASHRHLPRFAVVRNPFSWYVSWFHYKVATQGAGDGPPDPDAAFDPFFELVTDGGQADFGTALRRAFDARPELQGGAGPYSQLLMELVGADGSGCRFGRMETLREDLSGFLQAVVPAGDGGVPAPMAAAIQERPAHNTSKHAHFSSYYDPKLRALVEARDRAVFDLFGYAWEEPPGQES